MNAEQFQRNTRQRKVILEELSKTTAHPTAVQLYGAVRRRLPKISLGTVYRNLELLARTGRIVKLELAGAEIRFDADLRPHDHIRCVSCGRVDDLAGPPPEIPVGGSRDFGGYEVIGHRLEFVGRCPRCRKSI